MDTNCQQIKSLYEATNENHLADTEVLEFVSKNTNTSFTQDSTRRKRIYGEEYKEPTLLNFEPQSKILKLEPPVHEEISLDIIKNQSSSSTTNHFLKHNHPYPTKTQRNFNYLHINLKDVPKLCNGCYSSQCICHISKNKSTI